MKKAIVLILSICIYAKVLATEITDDDRVRMRKLAIRASCITDSVDFWMDAKNLSVKQCGRNYMEKLDKKFIPLQDNTEFESFLTLLKTQIIDFCGQHFETDSKTIMRICPVNSECDGLTCKYDPITDPDGQTYEKSSPLLVARKILQQKGPNLESMEEFKEVYMREGPCNRVYDKLAEEDMADYVEFSELFVYPMFYHQLSSAHKTAARIVLGCKFLQSDDNDFLDTAYESYCTIAKLRHSFKKRSR